MKHRWVWWSKEDLRIELRQLADEGSETRTVDAEFARLLAPETEEDVKFQEAVETLLEKCSRLPLRPGYKYDEPSDLEGIRKRRPSATSLPAMRLSSAERRSRLGGAWLGRCAGCLLGKPVEGVPGSKLRQLLDCAGLPEINDYLWCLPGLSDENLKKMGFENLIAYRNTERLVEDDDPKYTIIGMLVVRRKGLSFTASDVGDLWMEYIPVLRTFTAERAAYRNFLRNIEPPRSAIVGNPYREYIGAQIRADFFGYVAPGRPELAAELAWRDGSISHTKNGIYGEMWVAAMLAAAAVEQDIVKVVEAGLAEIPANCRLAEAIRDVIEWRRTGKTYAEAVRSIQARWSETDYHDWVHTISNAQVVATALLYSEGDFGTAICRSVQPGYDTDCNGATVGSVMGMLLGVEALPQKWTGIMNDTIDTGLPEFGVTSISGLADQMFAVQEACAKQMP